MKLDFKSSGGYINLSLELNLDTDDLPQEIADKLQNLVMQANFFDIQQEELPAANSGPPDIISYHLTVVSGNYYNSILCNDITAPPSLLSLLGFLQELALEKKANAG